MLASAMLLIPVLVCGSVGAIIGYFCRFRPRLRRVLTVGSAVSIFLLFEVLFGALSSKYSLKENLIEQLGLLGPFIFLYLLPAVFMSFLVARQWRRWWS